MIRSHAVSAAGLPWECRQYLFTVPSSQANQGRSQSPYLISINVGPTVPLIGGLINLGFMELQHMDRSGLPLTPMISRMVYLVPESSGNLWCFPISTPPTNSIAMKGPIVCLPAMMGKETEPTHLLARTSFLRMNADATPQTTFVRAVNLSYGSPPSSFYLPGIVDLSASKPRSPFFATAPTLPGGRRERCVTPTATVS